MLIASSINCLSNLTPDKYQVSLDFALYFCIAKIGYIMKDAAQIRQASHRNTNCPTSDHSEGK